jgi:hypothetical protein
MLSIVVWIKMDIIKPYGIQIVTWGGVGFALSLHPCS